MPFHALGLHSMLVRATREIHYVEPTPIQAQAIPPILAGRDLLATAQTGTGKTAAFLLPILHRLLGQPQHKIQALIRTPTRELALPIPTVLRGLARHIPLRSGVVLGGTAMGPQDKLLRDGAEIIIATTGRLLDHLRSNPSCLASVHTFVLDEADRMLDMGFLPDTKRIVSRLPARRQTLMFSATMPAVIPQLARQLLRNPLAIGLGRHTTAGALPAPGPKATPGSWCRRKRRDRWLTSNARSVGACRVSPCRTSTMPSPRRSSPVIDMNGPRTLGR